jgi:PAS domain S-box-containing protein
MQTLDTELETLQILLVEDNPDDRELFQHHIQSIKSKEILLESCDLLSSALNRLTKGGVDAVFLDLSLPDSTGIDTFIKLHKLVPRIPIVILTGTDDDQLAVHALQLGAQDYLVKGNLDTNSLRRSIIYAIERQHGSEASSWLEAVVQNSIDAIFGKSLENVILSWNKGAEKIYGYSASEMVGKKVDLLLPADKPKDSLVILEKIKSGESVEQYETERRRKDGHIIQVSISASPIKSGDGIITGVSVVTRDITKQKLTEKMLKESDERLSRAISASQTGLWDWNLMDGTVLWDRGMYRLFGVLEGKFVPSFEAFLECVHQDDRDRTRKILESKILSANTMDFDFRIVRTDGIVRYIQGKGEVFADEFGRANSMSGVCFDITDRKIAALALAESEQRLNLALESGQMGVWELDLQRKLMWRSLRHDQIFGYESLLPEWNHKTFISHVVPEDRALAQQQLDSAISQGNYNIECRIISARDQAICWISAKGKTYYDENGVASRLLGTVMDITEAKELENLTTQLHKRRDQITHAIVEHAPIGVVVLDKELNITYVNKSFASILESNPDELVNQSLTAVLPHQELAGCKSSVETVQPIQIARMQIVPLHESSSPSKYCDLSLWPVVNDDGTIAGSVLQVVDCTQTILLEEQRDDFVASVAHDIKNPLSAAERLLDVLCNQSAPGESEENAQMLIALRDSNQHMLTLVQNLVDVYRCETAGYSCCYESVDLVKLIDSCILLITPFAHSRQIVVHAQLPDSIDSIQADNLGLKRVLMNLLHNGVKFTKPRGKVDLAIEQSADRTIIRVTDTGCGISIIDQEKLFKRYNQGMFGKLRIGGTGLGLYLSKQIINAQLGTIICESKEGVGSTFLVTLPNFPPISRLPLNEH